VLVNNFPTLALESVENFAPLQVQNELD